jgi:hypothetical protein
VRCRPEADRDRALDRSGYELWLDAGERRDVTSEKRRRLLYRGMRTVGDDDPARLSRLDQRDVAGGRLIRPHPRAAHALLPLLRLAHARNADDRGDKATERHKGEAFDVHVPSVAHPPRSVKAGCSGRVTS